MEKKKYEELELEVVRLDAEDVIATSSAGSCGVVSENDCNQYTSATGDYYEYYCFAV